MFETVSRCKQRGTESFTGFLPHSLVAHHTRHWAPELDGPGSFQPLIGPEPPHCGLEKADMENVDLSALRNLVVSIAGKSI